LRNSTEGQPRRGVIVAEDRERTTVKIRYEPFDSCTTDAKPG
jgi:hypothetical protein